MKKRIFVLCTFAFLFSSCASLKLGTIKDYSVEVDNNPSSMDFVGKFLCLRIF